MAAGRLDPVAGREGVFAVHMEWGDAVELPPETDGGAIERDEVTVSLPQPARRTSRGPTSTAVGAALDGLLAGPAPTLRP